MDKPDWAMSLDSVSRFPLGSRIRFAVKEVTGAGVTFEAGEEATVIEHRLAPVGVVFMTAQTDDGRTFMTGAGTSWEPVS